MLMASPTAHQLVVLLLVLASPLPAAMSSACASEAFPSGKAYATCHDLPELGAALHWTYHAADASSSGAPPSLSLAFVAAPAAPGGWVAWGINPTGTGGMVGTQALLAFVSAGASAPTVRTYNITGYDAVGAASTPVAFPAAAGSLAADVVGGGGRIRLYATLRLGEGMEVVDQVWQVGPSVTRGAPDAHAMAPRNLAARGKLVLSAGAVAASAPARAGGPSSGDRTSSSSWPPSRRQVSRAAGADSVSTAAHVVLALLGFWAVVE